MTSIGNTFILNHQHRDGIFLGLDLDPQTIKTAVRVTA